MKAANGTKRAEGLHELNFNASLHQGTNPRQRAFGWLIAGVLSVGVWVALVLLLNAGK